MKTRVLLVDDESKVHRLVERMLVGSEYELSYVADVDEVLPRVTAWKPAVILCDLLMPKQSGIEVCQILKKDPIAQHIPIIILTNMGEERALQMCLEAGADDFLNKTVSPVELIARLRSMTRIHRQFELLNRAIKLREDFAHMVVHDLGNPLGCILLETDNLLHAHPNSPHELAWQQIRRSVLRARGLANDMLLMAKIESGKLTIHPEPTLLSPLAQRAIDAQVASARRRQVTVRLEVQGEEPHVPGDASLIERVFENLVSNAIKFSPRKGEVLVVIQALPELSPAAAPRRVRVEVRDRGCGIPQGMRERVFEKYEIAEVNESVPQMGLGLAFCRLAIQAHGGAIGLDDHPPQGLIVWFEL